MKKYSDISTYLGNRIPLGFNAYFKCVCITMCSLVMNPDFPTCVQYFYTTGGF